MKRIAIVGGGIAGVAAAYEIALHQRAGAAIEFVLFEAGSRLGGIVETVRRDGFVIECGPDSWVTEKPWARELAIELGLENELVSSNDERRKTYIVKGNELTAMPDGMRMMVPTQWGSVANSPLFSDQAKLAYLHEPEIAERLKATALDAGDGNRDESVRDFVMRHFGEEVANTIAAPLLCRRFRGRHCDAECALCDANVRCVGKRAWQPHPWIASAVEIREEPRAYFYLAETWIGVADSRDGISSSGAQF